MSAFVDPVASKDRTKTYHLVGAASDNANLIFAGPCRLLSVFVAGIATAPRYVKLYNKATAPAPATDNALLQRTIIVPVASLAANGAGAFLKFDGIYFPAGLAIAITLNLADTDDTAIGAGDCWADVEYDPVSA